MDACQVKFLPALQVFQQDTSFPKVSCGADGVLPVFLNDKAKNRALVHDKKEHCRVHTLSADRRVETPQMRQRRGVSKTVQNLIDAKEIRKSSQLKKENKQ